MLFLATLVGASGLTNNYSLSLNPLPAYNFRWSTDADNIYIALDVSTDGWVGFGIGEPTSGSMPGSDLFRAYVDSTGKATIQDGYAIAKAIPHEDDCQDWVLVSAQRENGRTIVEARRKLDTGDAQDRPVDLTGTSRLVFSYSSSSSFSVGHDVNRVGLAVNLANGIIPVYEPSNGVLYFDIRNNHTPAVTVTEYYDAWFDVPIAGPVHVIGATMLTDSPYFNLVHHITLSGYYLNDDSAYMMYVWAPGVGDLDVKAPCGFRVGNTSANSVMGLDMQTHFNNPSLQMTGVDTTGIRLYYTTTLRSNDCGVLDLGDPAVQLSGTALPTGLSALQITCPASITNGLGTKVMTVFGSILHMHALGQQVWTTVNGVIQNKIDFYDFGFQQQTDLLGKGFAITAGDVVQTTCVYDAPDGNEIFGLASSQEMCINYVFYYPRLPISACGIGMAGVTHTEAAINAVFPRAFANSSGGCTHSPTPPTASTLSPTPGGSGPHKGAASSLYLAPAVLVAIIALALLH